MEKAGEIIAVSFLPLATTGLTGIDQNYKRQRVEKRGLRRAIAWSSPASALAFFVIVCGIP